MTIIYAAATSLVNPPGESPVLSLDQLWKGLERKVIEPELFIAVIDTCVVLEADEESVLREVKFKDGGGEGTAPVIGPKVQERITHIAPLNSTAGSGLETFQSIGNPSRVLNIVSTGGNGELYLTFTFEWDHPEIVKGSEEETAKQKAYQVTAPKSVEGTVAAIRKMTVAGQL